MKTCCTVLMGTVIKTKINVPTGTEIKSVPMGTIALAQIVLITRSV
ncbi:MAG TPA: hypothetical protein PK982_03375 [Anaerolineaceae bacterium]|nr:hypothetical protein [Anaerolineaceae bacterium]